MRKSVYSIFILYVILLGSTCRPNTCPPTSYNYNLYHLTERGFNHIFSIEEDCSGCHHVSAEKCGLVKIQKIKQGNHGIFTGKVEKIKGNSCKKEESTFFPQEWSIQSTLNKIEEAYNNIIRTDEKGKIGKTSEGILIRIIPDKKKPDKIFNAFPILEQQERQENSKKKYQPYFEREYYE